MNQKRCKAIRQALRKALGIPGIVSEYSSRISKSKHIELPYESDQDRIAAGASEGGKRLFWIDALSIELSPRCSRRLYKQTKRISAGGGFKINNWRPAEELWAPVAGFYPDCRALDITPKPPSGNDNPREGGPYDGLPKDEQGNEQAQAG